MNDDDDKLTRDLLDRATSRSASPSSDDAASLRQGFLALGRAIDAAQSEWSEADLLSRLDLAAAATARQKKEQQSTLLYWFAAGVLAASALFATARILLTGPGDVQEVVATQPAPDASSQEAAIAAEQGHQEAEAKGLAGRDWSDPLDQELAAAENTLGSYLGFDAQVDRSLADIQGQLESLSADLASGSL
jgi:hypothetical protein